MDNTVMDNDIVLNMDKAYETTVDKKGNILEHKLKTIETSYT